LDNAYPVQRFAHTCYGHPLGAAEAPLLDNNSQSQVNMTTLTFAEQLYAESLDIRKQLQTIDKLFKKYSTADADWNGDLCWECLAPEAFDVDKTDEAIAGVFNDIDTELLYNLSNRYQGFAALLQHALMQRDFNS
jgi:hypothetical protein